MMAEMFTLIKGESLLMLDAKMAEIEAAAAGVGAAVSAAVEEAVGGAEAALGGAVDAATSRSETEAERAETAAHNAETSESSIATMAAQVAMDRDLVEMLSQAQHKVASWATLSAVTGVAGDVGYVSDADAGTHTDPISGDTVANAGIYEWAADGLGSVQALWVGDTGLAGAAKKSDGFRTSSEKFPAIMSGGVELLGFDENGKALFAASDAVLLQVLTYLKADPLSLSGKVGPADGFTVAPNGFPSILSGGIELLGFGNDGKARFVVSQMVADQIASMIDLEGGGPAAPSEVLMAAQDVINIGDSMSQTSEYKVGLESVVTGSVAVLANGGATASTMATMFGAKPLYLDLENEVIPASGPVNVTGYSAHLLFSGGSFRGTFNCSINGVDGVVSVPNSDSQMVFTRNDAGSVVSVPDGTEAILDPENGTAYVPATNAYKDRTVIVRLGRNGSRTTRAQRKETTLDPIRYIVDALTPRVKQVIVVNVFNGRNLSAADGVTPYEPSGSAGYETVMTLNEELKREFGPMYVDLRSAAVQNAIYDIGNTPTAQDLADIAADCIPSSLFNSGDNVHLGSDFNTWAGQWLGRYLNSLGYTKGS